MKNILISGGTRGLGLAIVQRLSREGYHAIATGRQMSDELQQLVDAQNEVGRVSFSPLDLRSTSDVHEMIRAIVREHGQLYGLVNNAAVGIDGVLGTMHDSQIEDLIRVNVLGTILVTKYASRSMLLGREGRIINIASVIGHTGFSGLSVYAATKAALYGFTKSLARELGKAGITVNSVSPGYMETDMTSAIDGDKLATIRRRSPLGRLAGVDDVAGAVGYLLSDQAGAITGTDLVVDAGSTA